MKKIAICLFTVLLVFSLEACNQKLTNNDLVMENEAKISDNLIIDIGESDKFDKQEIKNAIEVVKENFSFPASTLIRIYYDEEKSDYFVQCYLDNGRGQENEVKSENIIVLLTDFDVDDSGDNPVLNADSRYENYNWILIREDDKSKWEIEDQGY